jgi:integrase
LLQCFHATGARTSELLAARAADFQPITHQLVLGKHKRSKTLTEPAARRIALNAEVLGIVRRRCKGRPTDAAIFTQPRNGRPWDRHSAAERFCAVRERAGVRSTITIYSFRHLWISEMLMANVDVLLVARMAGTSVAMIEQVYGHFRNQSYQDAQAKLDRERSIRGL